MVETILSRSVRVMFSGGVALSIGMLAQPVFAQDTTTAAPVQRVEITGSNIRRVDAETPSPVQVITADEMKKSGYTSIADVLTNITANGQGTLSQGFSGAFAAGASGISLRGLNTSATLVLIDGHRMAPYALSDDGQRSFVDTSNIPFDTIERIEILKDGASAVYGSDAMAGVVNIILKKNIVGTTVNAEGGTSTQGGGTTYHASITHGLGDFEEDGYNAYASLEYRKENKVTALSRAGNSPNGGWTTQNWAPYGGINQTRGVVTATNPVPFVLSPYLTNPAFSGALTDSTAAANTAFLPGGSCTSLALLQGGGCAYTPPNAVLQPQTENINLLGSFSKKLNDGWRLDLKASLFESKVNVSPGAVGMPQNFSPLVAVSAGVLPHTVGTAISQITVPANYPGNTLGVPALLNGAIPGVLAGTDVKSKATRLVADLTGSIGEWDLKSALGYTRNEVDQTVFGSMNVPAFNAAVNRATNPFNVSGVGNSAADMAAIFPTATANDISTLAFAEVHASRSLMTMAGGDMAISTGASYIYRKLDAPAPDLVAQGIVGGNNAFVQGNQTNAALFGELNLPVLKSLELDADARLDHFDAGVGNAGTGGLKFKWTPTNAFAFRGSYSTGFRAPNPAEDGLAGQSYVTGHYDHTLCPGGPTGNAAGTSGVAGAPVAACGSQLIFNGAAPAGSLSPEKSTSATLGAILEPVKGWSSTLDLYQIKVKDQIIAGPADFANPSRATTPLAQPCYDGNGGTYTCTPALGNINYYSAHYINANSTEVKGLELESHYKFKMGEYGNLRAAIDYSHTMSYILTQPGVGEAQLAGSHGPVIIGGDTANPKDRIQVTLGYEKDAVSVTTTANYVSGYSLLDPSYGLTTCHGPGGALVNTFNPSSFPNDGPDNYCHVGSFTTVNFVVGYKFSKQLNFHFAMDNAFNRQPPADLTTYGGTVYQYNPSLHQSGAIGRFLNAGLTYSF